MRKLTIYDIDLIKDALDIHNSIVSVRDKLKDAGFDLKREISRDRDDLHQSTRYYQREDSDGRGIKAAN